MRIHFIHIGKTGGTSIIYALLKYKDNKYQFTLHPHETVLSDIPRGEKFFFSTRDPLTRFQSAFYSRQRQGRPRYTVDWSESESKCYKYYSTPEKLASELSSPLPWKRNRAKFAMNSIMHIKLSFWNWLGDEKHFLSRKEDLIFVLRQENLNDDFERFKQILSINDSKILLPSNDQDAFRNPDNVNYELSKVATRNIKKWYAKDYDFLGLISRLEKKIIPHKFP